MRFFLTVIAFLLCHQTVSAAEYYAGRYQCDKVGVLNVSLENRGSKSDFVVWYRRLGENSFTGRQGEANWNDGLELNFTYGGLVLEQQDDGLKGYWLAYKGKASDECERFTLEKVNSPLERYQEVIALATSAELLPPAAIGLREKFDDLPPKEMLPELDQEELAHQLQTAYSSYFERFEQRISDVIMQTPVDGDGEAYVVAAQDYIDVGVVQRGGLASSTSLVNWLNQQYSIVANRLEQAGASPAILQIGGEALCVRIKAFDFIHSEAAIPAATRLPLAFWSRELAQSNLDGLKQCKLSKRAQWIADNFRDISQQVETRQAAVGEVNRLLELPATADNFKQTDGFEVDAQLLRQWNYSERQINAVISGRLDQKRKEAQAAFAVFIKDQIDLKLDDPEAETDGWRICRDLLGESSNLRQQFSDACQQGVSERRAEMAVKEAGDKALKFESDLAEVETIEQASSLNWLVPPRDLARDLVPPADWQRIEALLAEKRQLIVTKIDESAAAAIAAAPESMIDVSRCGNDVVAPREFRTAIQTCRRVIAEHNEAIAVKNCDTRLQAIGAADIAKDRLLIPEIGADITFQRLFCHEFPNQMITVSRSGWFGTGDYQLSIDHGGVVPVGRLREDAKRPGYWSISAVEGFTVPAGKPLAICLFQPNECGTAQ